MNPILPPTVSWPLAHGRHLVLGPRALVMGVLNVTPDSFSDGGLHLDPRAALAAARAMIGEGADIIDVGGESTRPGAEPIGAQEEQRRVLPVIRALAHENGAIISVDTYRAETARLAVEAGAHIVNDVWGAQREPEIARVAARTGAGLVLMHTGREREKLPDVIEDQRQFFALSLRIAEEAGVKREAILLDPGFGFAKEVEENAGLMRRFEELAELGFPLLVGTSRKRFVRALSGCGEGAGDAGTVATSVMLRERGASIFRVHAVRQNREALDLADAVLHARKS